MNQGYIAESLCLNPLLIVRRRLKVSSSFQRLMCVISLEFLTTLSSGFKESDSAIRCQLPILPHWDDHVLLPIFQNSKIWTRNLLLYVPAFRSEFWTNQNSDLKPGTYRERGRLLYYMCQLLGPSFQNSKIRTWNLAHIERDTSYYMCQLLGPSFHQI